MNLYECSHLYEWAMQNSSLKVLFSGTFSDAVGRNKGNITSCWEDKEKVDSLKYILLEKTWLVGQIWDKFYVSAGEILF